ncbi:MAG: hypothetical protein WBA17_09035 [Saprospiraceae bacterium]
MTQPRTAHYADSIRRHLDRSAAARRRYRRLGWLRLLLFGAGAAAVLLLWTGMAWYAGLLGALLFIGGFAAFVRFHQRVDRQASYHEHRAALAAAEDEALHHEFGAWSTGLKFLPPDHPYAADLDVFGPTSLYQFICRAFSAPGKQRLADYLLAPAPFQQITDRQAALTELAADPEFCHHLRALGADLDDEPRYRAELERWLALPPVVLHRPGLRLALWAVPVYSVLAVVALILFIPWQLAILLLIPAGLLLRQTRQRVTSTHELTRGAVTTLHRYVAVLAALESATFTAPLLVRNQQFLLRGGGAAAAIRHLAYTVSQLDVRYNAFALPLEFAVLWSLQFCARLDRWKRRHGTDLPAWFDALAEFDALVSGANLVFNQPAWHYPAISDVPRLRAVGLGHPLIHPTGRVSNDIEMSTNGHIHLVTGSNMAGKSTWLRTVGINIVLGMAGLPVCAASLTIPRLQVYTSMRTQDALAESTSSFFAELKRLKFIIQATENPALTGGLPVFFLLDEILKGTNSRDRHTGGRALIRQLIRARGAGLIATHDIELADLETTSEGRVENWSMEVSLTEGGKLDFDYRLRRGVSKSFNATLLMRQMGINISEEDLRIN